MKFGFYPKLAFDGIRKNKRMYLPYILTCIGMVMMYYIVIFLQDDELIDYIPGSDTIASILGLGGWVIAAFSCIFLFYTNSFLIRRRKKEFGLYSILGMGRWNIGRILFWESVLIAVFSLGIGLAAGIALSKIAELGLVNIVRGDVSYSFAISSSAIVMAIGVFGVIFLLLLLNGLRQVRFSTAISLLRSEAAGEKPPKGNWFFGLLGVLLLGGAYYIAVTVQDPITAMVMFLVAVIMVIVGSYLCFIAGSVLLCRILQKKKSYYYQKNHFVSVSSMVYRMKRNGAGLASICIIATMVLVMISSTTSLYFGEEGSLASRYPRDINFTIGKMEASDMSDEAISVLREDIDKISMKYGAKLNNSYAYRCAAVAGMLEGETVETDASTVSAYEAANFGNIYQFYFVPLADYNALYGTKETLGKDEALLYISRGSYDGDEISFVDGGSFKIKKHLDEFVSSGDSAMQIVTTITLVLPDLENSLAGLQNLADFNGDRRLRCQYIYNFDTDLDKEKQIELFFDLRTNFIPSEAFEKYNYSYIYIESQEHEREDFYGLYGGLLYLGIMLSIVFLFAAVLIIYYKQISEGYEDQSRFEIMKKVGMTDREIRKSINSQLLTVFFLPLAFAAMHLAFAFPIIRKLLLLFNLNNVWLFAGTNVLCFLVFALFYTLVYRITSGAYYNIVSGRGEQGSRMREKEAAL